MNIWLTFAVLSGPAIYWIASLNKQNKATDFESFHYAGRTVKPQHYVDSTVMYAMQVAALTLFATWGFLYGLGTVWVPLFWGLGYWLLAKLIESGKLDSFLKQEHLGTIHQFLADKSKWRLLGAFAAIISLFGILGPAMYEAEFVGKTVARLYKNGGGTENILAFGLFVGFVTIATVYILFGGFRAIVRTDLWQLSIGFSGFSLFTAILLYRVALQGNVFGAMILTLTMLLFSIWLIFMWRLQNSKLLGSLLSLLVALLSYGVALFAILMQPSATDSWKDFLQIHQFGKPFGLGAMSLISLLVANGLYQIVDVGQWQRLASIQMDTNNFEDTKQELAKSVRYIMVYSPITWFMAIVFGMALKYLMPELTNPYDAVGAFVVYYWEISPWLIILFIVAIVAIMLSTVDSLVSAITFTLHNDCLVAFNPHWRTLKAGRILTVVFLVLGFYAYTHLSANVSNFADILYTCWAFQISLFPLVMIAIFRNTLSAPTALISLIAGIIASLLPLFLKSLNPYEHGPTLSLLASGIVMLIGTALFKPRE